MSQTIRPAQPEPAEVAESAEQFAPVGRGIELCYQTYGDPSDEPLLLVMGLGGPMTWWDPELCRQLALAGFYVVRFDNRDVGRSTKLERTERSRVTFPKLAKAFVGLRVTPPYTLADMADDVVGLLDHLGLDSTHLFGISMGGMIVQTMAINHPDRVRSVVSMMSTTGKRTVGFQHPSLIPTLLARKVGRDAYVEGSVKIWRMIGSPGFPATEAEVRRRAEDTYERGVSGAAVARQMLAVITQPDRTRDLRRVTAPMTVIHGLADKMVHVSGGRATSMAVPGSELLLIDGMGHDLPPALWPTYVAAVRRTADRACLPPHQASGETPVE